jgi:spermidine synthase
MSRSTFRTGAWIALASGCAALAHELLWTRRLVDLLGASAEATARVLGCFFLGLALGSALSTRFVPRLRRPWRAMGLLELGIAVLTLPALFLPWWTDWLWPTLGPARLVTWHGSLVKLAVSLVVVLPPSLLMGMTLPVLAAAVLQREGGLGREGVWLYALNTLGGVVGLLLTALFTLPLAGVAGAMGIALGFNLCIAGACLFLDTRRASSSAKSAAEPALEASAPAGATRGWLLPATALAFVSGAGVLSLEVLAIHLLSNVAYSSLPASTALLTTVILVLALSAAVVPRITARFGSPSKLLPGVLAAVALVTLLSPLWFVLWTHRLTLLPRSGSTASYLFMVVSTSIATLGPALFIAGLVLPLTFAWCDERAGRDANRRWGWLLAANGLGGLLGAELASEVLMPAFGLHQGIGAVATLYAAAALVAWVKLAPATAPMRRAVTAVGGVSVLLGALFALGLQPQVSARVAPEVIELITGRDGVVAVSEAPGSGRGIVVNNQYLLGASAGLHDERRQMLLPLLLHGDARRVAHIGNATGITPGAALDVDEVEWLASVELSPAVAILSARHFADFNGDLGASERAEIVVEDGRTYLASAVNEFDVIVGDLYRPSGAGEGRLFSIEHFRAARAALRERGLFCQWLPMFQLSEPQFEVIVATFLEVFPQAHLVRGNLKATEPLLGLVGLREGELDWAALPERCADLRADGRIVDGALRHAEGVRMLYLGPIERGFAATSRINTLDNAWIEIDAGNLAVTTTYDRTTLLGDRWVDFERRLFQRLGGDAVPRWTGIGREITALQHERTSGPSGGNAGPPERVFDSLSTAMQNDSGADRAAFPDR